MDVTGGAVPTCQQRSRISAIQRGSCSRGGFRSITRITRGVVSTARSRFTSGVRRSITFSRTPPTTPTPSSSTTTWAPSSASFRKPPLRWSSPTTNHPARWISLCKVEVYLRREKIHYFFAYPADYADTVIIYNDLGALERQLQKAAFEVVFAYNESSGTLDLFVQGDKNLRRDMEEIFARLVLKEELPEEGAGRQPYELNGLRSRDFDFPTDPEDSIQDVRVKALRLSIVGPGFGRITFESDARRKRGDIYDLMEKSLNQIGRASCRERV